MDKPSQDPADPDPVSDEVLMARIVAGGPAARPALESLYVRHRRPLMLFLRRRGLDTGEAEDLVQEVFVRLWRRADQFRGDSSVSTWLHTIARNMHADRLRQSGHESTMDNEEDWQRHSAAMVAPAPDAGRCLDRKAFEECYRREYRRFAIAHPAMHEALDFVLRGHDGRELAAFLCRSEGATRQFLLTCRQRLKVFLAPCGELYHAQVDGS